MKKLLILTALSLASLVCTSAHATVVISNASPDWQQVGTGPTWVLPATIPGCGSESEPACEPTGLFYGNVAWSGVPEYISFTDDAGTSDIITFDSLGPGGVFRVQFFSDPNPGSSTPPPGYIQFGTDFIEDGTNGATSGALPICCELGGVSVNLGSDGEGFFDPFGFGGDTSDGIQFTGNVVAAPGPATLMLLGVGLAGLAAFRRRKAA